MRRFICFVITIFVMITVASCLAKSQNSKWEEVFFKANQAYKEGHFRKAIDGYNRLIQSGHENGHIYYNLGNAYSRLDEIGRAILNYERARLFIPRDPDLRFNLHYVRDKVQDAIPETQSSITTAFFWLRSLSLDEVLFSFVVLNFFFWTILFIRLFLRTEWTYYLFVILLVFWVITGLSFGLKWYQVETDNRVVVLDKEVSILAGPDMKDTVLFKLHEGDMVHHERSEDGWYLISLPDGKRGWINAKAVESITVTKT